MRTISLLALGLLGIGAVSYQPRAAARPTPVAARPTAPAPAADVLRLANAFLATLTAAQRQAVIADFTAANAAKWSNLPFSIVPRLGLPLSKLSAPQAAAALAVVRAATGPAANEGYDEIQQLRAADDNLAAVPASASRGPMGPPPGGGPGGPPPGAGGGPPGQGPGGGPPPGRPGGGPGGLEYGSGLYSIAFLGTPSATTPWMLQFGGHHLATNITFGNGAVTGASPKFEGTEPLRFTTTNAKVLPKGTTCAPLRHEAGAMLALLGSLSPAQKTQAKLKQAFFDVVVGPGHDGDFPATKVGVAGSALSASQRALLLAAMKPWVQDADPATAARLLADYEQQLAGTHVAYAGTGALTARGDYVRLDGPGVWIELVCQDGIVYRNQIHYHSIWRDHTRDYGGNFYSAR